jgi:protein-tyrosine phosphatase
VIRILCLTLAAAVATTTFSTVLNGSAGAVAPAVITVPAFTAATATDLADGTSTELSWAGAGAPVDVEKVASPASTSGPVVGHGSSTDQVTIGGLAPLAAGQRRYFRLVTTAGAALSISDRSLHLPDAKNARDVGGYRTTDGHWVREGVAFRSGQPSGLTPAEWSAVTDLGVRHLVDLRNVSERKDAAYTPPEGVSYQVADVFAVPPRSLPTLTDLLSTLHCVNPAVALNSVKILSALDDWTDAFTGGTYPLEACYHGALDAFGDLLTSLATDQTVLYHCSAGKDRTGVGTAILLTILGVPRETVVNDFLLSNTYRGPGSVQREWLDGWFDSVNAAWGSFGSYVKYGLLLNDATVATLKAKFLTTTQG